MPPPPRYTPAEKTALIAAARSQIRQGLSRKEVAHRLGINLPSLSGWLREATLNMIYPPTPPSMPRNRSR